MQIRFFSSPAVLAIAAAIATPLAGVVACGGHTVSLGTNQARLAIVDPSVVGGTGGAVPACGAGAAHPNVCCDAAPGHPANCGTYEGMPFHPCDTGWTTYPDPRTCCDLNDPSNCAEPPPQPGPAPTPVCSSLCPPGWYATGPSTCCQTQPGGGAACFGTASTTPGYADASAGTPGCEGDPNGYYTTTDAGGTICVHPDPVPTVCDGGSFGTNDAGAVCYDPNHPTPPPQPEPSPQPVPPPCEVDCPAGWVRASGAPDVCCRDDGNGAFECFSQSSGPIVDPGPPVPLPEPSGDSGPVGIAHPWGCGGSSDGVTCSCEGAFDGHTYSLACSASGCTCTRDGTTWALPSSSPSCQVGTYTTLWSDCGFPN